MDSSSVSKQLTFCQAANAYVPALPVIAVNSIVLSVTPKSLVNFHRIFLHLAITNFVNSAILCTLIAYYKNEPVAEYTASTQWTNFGGPVNTIAYTESAFTSSQTAVRGSMLIQPNVVGGAEAYINPKYFTGNLDRLDLVVREYRKNIANDPWFAFLSIESNSAFVP